MAMVRPDEALQKMHGHGELSDEDGRKPDVVIMADVNDSGEDEVIPGEVNEVIDGQGGENDVKDEQDVVEEEIDVSCEVGDVEAADGPDGRRPQRHDQAAARLMLEVA